MNIVNSVPGKKNASKFMRKKRVCPISTEHRIDNSVDRFDLNVEQGIREFYSIMIVHSTRNTKKIAHCNGIRIIRRLTLCKVNPSRIVETGDVARIASNTKQGDESQSIEKFALTYLPDLNDHQQSCNEFDQEHLYTEKQKVNMTNTV